MLIAKAFVVLILWRAVSTTGVIVWKPTAATVLPLPPRSPAWRDADLGQLVLLRGQGADWSVVSTALNRSKAACVQRYQAIAKLQTWNNERLDVLFESTCRLGENWAHVSATTGFTHDSCRTRYMQFIRSFQTGPWLPAEDALLMQAVDAPQTLQAFAMSLPPSWRRVSHLLRRSTADCRKRFHHLAFDIDLDVSQDVWYAGEAQRVEELRCAPRRPGWSEIGREVGRTAMQCYNLAAARQRPQPQPHPRPADAADVGDEVDSSEVALADADATSGSVDDDVPIATPYVDFSAALQEAQESVQLFSSLGPFFRLPFIGSTPTPPPSQPSPSPLSLPPPPPATTVTTDAGLDTPGNDPTRPLLNERVEDAVSGDNDTATPVFGRRKSRKWSTAEDASLLSLVAARGTQWTAIGGSLGRTAAQCFQRHQILQTQQQAPPRGWDATQKAELVRLVGSLGPKWTAIGAAVGRTAYVCRAAYKRMADKGDTGSIGSGEVEGKGGLPGGDSQPLPPLLLPQPLRFTRRVRSPGTTQQGSDTDGTDAAATAVETDIDTDGRGGGRQLWAKVDDDILKGLVATLGRRWSRSVGQVACYGETAMVTHIIPTSPLHFPLVA